MAAATLNAIRQELIEKPMLDKPGRITVDFEPDASKPFTAILTIAAPAEGDTHGRRLSVSFADGPGEDEAAAIRRVMNTLCSPVRVDQADLACRRGVGDRISGDQRIVRPEGREAREVAIRRP
jgi:hypothetical protein